MGIRKNYRDLTTEEQSRFVEALFAAKARGVVDQFASLHASHFAHGIHRSSHFLPWHRELLVRFERELQRHHPSVTIPYWDSTVDRSPSDPLWRNTFLGQFNSAWSLGRALGSAVLPSPQLVQTNQGRQSYDRFWTELEVDIHNPPHRWVAGVMARADSPGDPVFYLHHCWIDLLWARWQAAHPGAPFVSSGSGLGLDDPLMEWPDRTPADVLDVGLLGYCYDTLRPQLATTPRASGADMQPGEVLVPGGSLASANGRYTFVYQTDGNLVLYRAGTWLWDSQTGGRGAGVCILQTDGNLVVFDPCGNPIWESATEQPGSRLLVQDDGNVVLSDPGGAVVWETNTEAAAFSFRSANFPTRYLRHRFALAEVTEISSQLDRSDGTFNVVPGLGDPEGVSLEAVNYPGHYLRHQDSRVKLHPLADDDLYRMDATFTVVPGLADPARVSLRSLNFPSRFLRHRNFAVYVEEGSGPLFESDATFDQVSPLA